MSESPDDVPILKRILIGDSTFRYQIPAVQPSTNPKSQKKDLDEEAKLLAAVTQAHVETCDYTREKVARMFIRALENPQVIICPTMLKACPLNPQPVVGPRHIVQDISERFSPAIRGVVDFAKKLPGFSVLNQEDQVMLLKAGVFEVLFVRLACMLDSQTVRRDALQNQDSARFLLDSMFDFADQFNGLHLTDTEIGLFCAIVTVTADRPCLHNTHLVTKMHKKLNNALQSVLKQNHPENPTIYQELTKKIQDLRTLNKLHSEKLLAYKTTEQRHSWEDDSGIESPPTSPKETTEDMPVLKRALQAPPLYDTTLLMDEAYTPQHKKFRAMQNDIHDRHPVLQAHLRAPTSVGTSLVQSIMDGPRMTADDASSSHIHLCHQPSTFDGGNRVSPKTVEVQVDIADWQVVNNQPRRTSRSHKMPLEA